MINNVFLTGRPRCGKTTLIKEIIRELDLDARGFYTSEIREAGKRVGFAIRTLEGREGMLAHKHFKSSVRVGRYKVNIKDLEEIGVNSILKALREHKLIIIDEIGKMEMKSPKFKQAVIKALDSKNKVLATIKLTRDPFTDKIKNRKDVRVFHMTKQNRKEIKKEIINILSPILNSQ